MESKEFYIKRLLKTVGIGILGLIITEVLFHNAPLFKDSEFLTAVLFAGLPFGWMALRQIFGGIFVWGLWGIVIYLVCMIVFSVVIGWAIMLYRLIRDSIQLFLVCRAG